MKYCARCDKEYTDETNHDCKYAATSVGISKTIGHPSVDISVLHKEIWNEAIEAAYQEVYASNGPAWLAVNIRRLKK